MGHYTPFHITVQEVCGTQNKANPWSGVKWMQDNGCIAWSRSSELCSVPFINLVLNQRSPVSNISLVPNELLVMMLAELLEWLPLISHITSCNTKVTQSPLPLPSPPPAKKEQSMVHLWLGFIQMILFVNLIEHILFFVCSPALQHITKCNGRK